ncbi:hypothetical protein ACFC3O_00615 [Streptomyces sp. NPDC056007]|uniref:hypothetical protein n=1 Tax=Streptomyces sp. NPDC056007 TaxID=3345678 RepID=UPI0035D6D06B
MSRRKKAEETAPEPSRVAGGCVLAVLVLGLGAVLFAVLGTLAVLVVWTVGALALWRTVRRPVSDSSAPPPPREGRPSCRECAGHTLVSVASSGTQKGMLIYKTASPERPNHTHVHIAPGEVNER